MARDRILLMDGTDLTRGHAVDSYDGYTTIDTPDNESLHCVISVDGGEVTLHFIDHDLAKEVLESIVKNQFRGFEIDHRRNL